jgi:hypothetical protein
MSARQHARMLFECHSWMDDDDIAFIGIRIRCHTCLGKGLSRYSQDMPLFTCEGCSGYGWYYNSSHELTEHDVLV